MTRWATLLLLFTVSPLAAEPNDDAPPKAKDETETRSREITVNKRYLHLPVKNGAPKRRMTFTVDAKVVREFDIELAEDKPDFWVFADVSAFRKATLTVAAALPGGSKALDALKLADDVPSADQLYKEKHRPLFHFTARRGWLNDPNGLVWHEGRDARVVQIAHQEIDNCLRGVPGQSIQVTSLLGTHRFVVPRTQ